MQPAAYLDNSAIRGSTRNYFVKRFQVFISPTSAMFGGH
jgi:hypothetical protein